MMEVRIVTEPTFRAYVDILQSLLTELEGSDPGKHRKLVNMIENNLNTYLARVASA